MARNPRYPRVSGSAAAKAQGRAAFAASGGFVAVAGAALSAIVDSNLVTLANIGAGVALTITGGSYSKNGAAFATAPTAVSDGDTLRLRVTSSASNGATTTVTATIGGSPRSFSVTTAAAPGAALSISGTLTSATVGGADAFAPVIAGGTPSYTLSLLSGTLPPGRAIGTGADNLKVVGTYTTAGSYSYTLRVTDSVGATADLAVGPVVVAAALDLVQQMFASGDTGLWIDMDRSSAFSDVAGTTPATANGTIGKVLDLSGGGNHIVASGDDATRPKMRAYSGNGFDSGKWLEVNGQNQALLLPANFAIDRQNFTAIFIYTGRPGTGGLLSTAATGTANIILSFNGTGTEQMAQMRTHVGASAQLGGVYTGAGMGGAIFRLGTGNRRYRYGRHSADLATAGAGSSLGGNLFRWQDGVSASMVGFNLKEMLFFQRALTDAELNNLQDYYTTKHGAASRNSMRFLLADGDSLTQGVGATTQAGGNYSNSGTGNGTTTSDAGNMQGEPQFSEAAQLTRLYPATERPKLVNFGTGGDRLATMAATTNLTNINAELSRAAAAGYTSLAVYLRGGINDIISDGATSAQLIQYAKDWATGITQAGTKKLISTLPPRPANSTSQETARSEFNTWITTTAVSGGWFAAVVNNHTGVDFADTAQSRDGLHGTALSYGGFATRAKAALDGVSF